MTTIAIAFAKPPLEDPVDRRYPFHYLLAQLSKLQVLRPRSRAIIIIIGLLDLAAWLIPLSSLHQRYRYNLDHADFLRTKRRAKSHQPRLVGADLSFVRCSAS